MWEPFEENRFIIITISIHCHRYKENEVTRDKRHKTAIPFISKRLSKAFKREQKMMHVLIEGCSRIPNRKRQVAQNWGRNLTLHITYWHFSHAFQGVMAHTCTISSVKKAYNSASSIFFYGGIWWRSVSSFSPSPWSSWNYY